MNLSKLCAGRKRNNSVWDLFTYNEATDKSICEAPISAEKTCGIRQTTQPQLEMQLVDQFLP
jgi:hypothetical protein